MTDVASLTIKVDSSGAKRATDDLDNLGTSAGKTERATGQLDRAWKAAKPAVVALATAGLAATAALTAMTAAKIKNMEQTGIMARQIGVTTEALSEMRYAASQMANVSDGQFDMALRRMTRRINEAAAGGGPAADAIDRMGLSAERLARLSPDEQFKRIADAMRDTTDQGDRLRNTMALMDTEGMPLVNMFEEGAAGIEQYTEEARKFGLTVGGDAARAASDFRSNIDRLKGSVDGLFIAVASDLLPDLVRLTDEFGNNALAGDDMANTADTIAQAVRGVGTAAKFAADWLAVAGNVAAGAWSAMAPHHDGMENWRRARDIAGSYFGGDEGVQVRIAGEDREPAGMFTRSTDQVNLDRRRQASADAADALRDEARATQQLTEVVDEHQQMMLEVEAHEEYVTESERARRNERYALMNREQDARERAMDRVNGVIEQLQFEHSLIGMTSVEREKAIALRYLDADATDEQRRAVEELIEKIEGASTAREDMDFLRDGARDLFSTVVTDSQRASDALDRFFDNLKRRAADRVFESLMAGFAGMGGGGGWGGFATAFAEAFTGGTKAAGGPLQAGQGYVVGDGGKPELFVPGQSGTLYPMGQGGMGGTPVVNLTVHGAPSQPQTRVKPNGSGGFDMEMIFKQVEGRMAESLDQGLLRSVGKSRFGWRDTV